MVGGLIELINLIKKIYSTFLHSISIKINVFMPWLSAKNLQLSERKKKKKKSIVFVIVFELEACGHFHADEQSDRTERSLIFIFVNIFCSPNIITHLSLQHFLLHVSSFVNLCAVLITTTQKLRFTVSAFGSYSMFLCAL